MREKKKKKRETGNGPCRSTGRLPLGGVGFAGPGVAVTAGTFTLALLGLRCGIGSGSAGGAGGGGRTWKSGREASRERGCGVAAALGETIAGMGEPVGNEGSTNFVGGDVGL